jgi:hypothetical protein
VAFLRDSAESAIGQDRDFDAAVEEIFQQPEFFAAGENPPGFGGIFAQPT